ncbi:hypothetical protein FKM82_027506 [Ascaphus truei]
MDSRSDLSDPEDLPPVPFLLSARRDVMVLSSDSDGEPSGVAAPRDLPGAGPPPPKKAKKSPEHVTVRIDPGLLQGGCGGQVLSALQTQETPCVIQKQPVPRSITWSRAGEDTQGAAPGLEETAILILVSGEEFVAMVQNCKKEPSGDGSSETLHSFTARVTRSSAGKLPTLVVMEMERYFRGNKGQKGQRRKRGVQDTVPCLSRVDVEEVSG